MPYIETTVTVCSGNLHLALELISAVFYELGLKGVIIDDQECVQPRVDPEDIADQQHAVVIKQPSITAYFESDFQVDQRLKMLTSQLKQIEKNNHILTSVTCRPLDEENWSESWKAFFQPVSIGRLVVKPSWQVHTSQDEKVFIEIDPGMAFGTGNHATTFMCLQMIEKYLIRGQTFLDIGTGSGILMIAAAALGALAVTGIDNDPVAVEVARENLSRNRVKNGKVILGNLADRLRAGYDMVAANILADAILNLLDEIRRVVKPGGFFIASGIIDGREDEVVSKMKSVGFAIQEIAARDEWVCVVGQCNPS